MEETLISKKELLDLTGISYGQLYRWKRKQLIPEEWFIRKSSFTGQETFFPKDKILGRIDKIVNMKENLSLNDIADKVSPSPLNILITRQDLLDRRIVSAVTIEQCAKISGDKTQFTFDETLFLYITDKLLLSGKINLDEGNIILQLLSDDYPKLSDKNCELVFIRKLGIATCLLTQVQNRIYFEKFSNVVFRINISEHIEELKLKLV